MPTIWFCFYRWWNLKTQTPLKKHTRAERALLPQKQWVPLTWGDWRDFTAGSDAVIGRVVHVCDTRADGVCELKLTHQFFQQLHRFVSTQINDDFLHLPRRKCSGEKKNNFLISWLGLEAMNLKFIRLFVCFYVCAQALVSLQALY